MDPQKTPQGNPLAFQQAKIAELQQKIQEVRPVLQCTMDRLTIVVAGRQGHNLVQKVFSFPPGSIPDEIKQFFENWANRMAGELLALETTIPIIKIDNHLVMLDQFVKEYTSGEIPSINPNDVEALQGLKPGEQLTILINKVAYGVQRIN